MIKNAWYRILAVAFFAIGFSPIQIQAQTSLLAAPIQKTEPIGDQARQSQRPNILMIAVDDLNDWIEPLGGHPQSQTPALASLASKGMNFQNAHCQSPLCNPSRTSLITSIRPSTSGIYGLGPWFREVESLRNAVTLPQHFRRSGYQTYCGGKIYHSHHGHRSSNQAESEFDHWGPQGGPGVMPQAKLVGETPNGNNPWVDWGVFPHQDSEKGDWIVADWAVKTIGEMSDEKPFFMAVGFFLPHVPCHVTQKWWDLYPEETLILPKMKNRERNGCSLFSWYLHWKLPEPTLAWLVEKNQHKSLVRSYLASITFMDSQIARVLEALERSRFADNTIVVLWSDHGWHLGEKEITGKTTLWERSTHVPLIFAGPGIKPGNCDQPVELLDVYPTLAELAGIAAPKEVQGVSLVAQIREPDLARKTPAITEHNPGNFGVRDREFRLIHYADGSEEMYHLVDDPNEFHNLIDDPRYQERAASLRRFIPERWASLAPGSHSRILEQRSDGWYWENKKIDPMEVPTRLP